MTTLHRDFAVVSVSDLIPYARNARSHSDAQIAQIAASIREFGFANPVLIDERQGIVAGHGRVLAARQLGMSEVPCVRLSGLSETQRRAYVIADNKLALNAGWDDEMLAVEIAELEASDFDVSLLGFSDEEINALDGESVSEGLTDDDDVPDAPRDAFTKHGDVWILGKHRLVCGSCVDPNVLDVALVGQRADLCLTDPPYGLGAVSDSKKNDYVEYEDTRENLIQLARDWLPLARQLSSAVVFSPGVTNQWLYPEPDWVMCWFYGGGQLRSSWGFNCWQPFLCYGKEPGLASGNGARPDAVNLNTPANAADIDHPCPKPVKLWEWFFDRLLFKPNALVLEPFCGSGTGLITAEKTGHRVSAIEITPYYCDVAIRRWQNFAGKRATLESTGQEFPS